MQNAPALASTLQKSIYARNILIFKLTWAQTSGFIRVLRQQWRILEQHAWAPRTCKALNSEKKAFVDFCLLADIEFLPVSGDILCLYAVWLWVTKRLKAPRSVRNYVSAVRTLHRRIGSDCHTPTSYGPLDLVLKAIARSSKHKVKKMFPVSPTILNNLLDSVPHNPLCPFELATLTMFKPLSLLLFQTMSRSSNMMP